MKRILILLLACIMLSPCLAACGNDKKSPDTTQETYWKGGDGTSPYDADGYLNDDLPADLKYGNDEIRILYWNNGELGPGEFDPDKDANNTVERSVYTRNKTTEERLQVSLSWTGINGDYNHKDEFLNKVTTAFTGGDETRFDMIAGYSQCMGVLATRGLVLDLLTSSKYLNLEKPWWPDSVVNDLTISNKLYFASGDISISFLGTMLSVFINKDYYPDDDLYDLVYNDEWTLETMMKMVQDKSLDRGTPEQKDLEDKFGLVVPWTGYLDGFFYGSNMITTDHNTSGALHVNSAYVGEKADDLCETLKTLFGSKDAWMPSPNDPNATHVGAVDLFARGESAMMVGTGTTILAYDSMKNTDVDYAVLPMPKYDKNQKEYKTVVLNLFTLWSISAGSTPAQGERAGAVMECLGSMGYREVTPVLFDKCLKVRYAKDGDTGKMYDIIRAGTVFDPGRIFANAALDNITQDGWQRCVIFNGVWGSKMANVDAELQEKLDRLCEAFRNNETINNS